MIGAFIIGFFGSLHCVGMCGPVMIAFMGSRHSIAGFSLYHTGRILTYVLLGSILGFIGASSSLFQLQQVLVLVLGLVLLTLYGVPSLRHRLEAFYYESSFYKSLRSFLSQSLSYKKKWFLSGVANGFFPCGLTYVAAAGAITVENVFEGTMFMVVFGLGTLPALIIVSFAGNRLFGFLKKLFPGSVSVLAILSGTIMVLRGLLSTFPHFNQMVQANASVLITVCGL